MKLTTLLCGAVTAGAAYYVHLSPSDAQPVPVIVTPSNPAPKAPAFSPPPVPTEFDPITTKFPNVRVSVGAIHKQQNPPGASAAEIGRLNQLQDAAIQTDVSRLHWMLEAYKHPEKRAEYCATMAAHFDQNARHIEGIGEAPERGMGTVYNDVCLTGKWPIKIWNMTCIETKVYPGDLVQVVVRYWQDQADYKNGFVTRVSSRLHQGGRILDHMAFDVEPQAVVDPAALARQCQSKPPVSDSSYKPS